LSSRLDEPDLVAALVADLLTAFQPTDKDCCS